MSRHPGNTGSDDPLRAESAPPQLGIFAATRRAVKGMAGRSAPEQREVDVPEPRYAPKIAHQPPAREESTIELPRYVEVEPREPALSMLSKGRHGM
ncbi:MAG: hypothetical protein ACRDTC_22875 [Pseudonocardiaceae bacterium]